MFSCINKRLQIYADSLSRPLNTHLSFVSRRCLPPTLLFFLSLGIQIFYFFFYDLT